MDGWEVSGHGGTLGRESNGDVRNQVECHLFHLVTWAGEHLEQEPTRQDMGIEVTL
jgi:hypothetical protein